MVEQLLVPLTHVLVARNWKSAISLLALTASIVAKSVAVSTPLRMGLSVIVMLFVPRCSVLWSLAPRRSGSLARVGRVGDSSSGDQGAAHPSPGAHGQEDPGRGHGPARDGPPEPVACGASGIRVVVVTTCRWRARYGTPPGRTWRRRGGRVEMVGRSGGGGGR